MVFSFSWVWVPDGRNVSQELWLNNHPNYILSFSPCRRCNLLLINGHQWEVVWNLGCTLTIVKERFFYSLVKVPASFVSRVKLWEAWCQKLLSSICHNYRVLENELNSNFLITVKNWIGRLSRKNVSLYSLTPPLDLMFMLKLHLTILAKLIPWV